MRTEGRRALLNPLLDQTSTSGQKSSSTEELEKTFRKGVKRLGTALEFGAEDRTLPADPEEFGEPVAIMAGWDHTRSLSTPQAPGSALLPVDEYIE
jgi:hypothetical protein